MREQKNWIPAFPQVLSYSAKYLFLEGETGHYTGSSYNFEILAMFPNFVK